MVAVSPDAPRDVADHTGKIRGSPGCDLLTRAIGVRKLSPRAEVGISGWEPALGDWLRLTPGTGSHGIRLD